MAFTPPARRLETDDRGGDDQVGGRQQGEDAREKLLTSISKPEGCGLQRASNFSLPRGGGADNHRAQELGMLEPTMMPMTATVPTMPPRVSYTSCAVKPIAAAGDSDHRADHLAKFSLGIQRWE
jgi:hypothetical protein